MRRAFVTWCLLGAVVAAARSAGAMGMEPPFSPYTIRVAILPHESHVEVTIRGDYRIVALQGGQVLQQGPFLARIDVLPGAGGIVLGTRTLSVNGIRIEPLHGSSVHVNGQDVRGAVEVSRQPDGTLLVVNELNVDAYLFGVLRREVSHTWPLEALKAQAIASRTYALYQSQQQRQAAAPKEFDVTATVASQVYGGRQSESWRTSRAVRDTYGLVLTYNGQLFPAYFHACCGGQTEAPSQVWGGSDQPPLRSLTCPWCITSPHYRWTREIMQRDLVSKLQAHQHPMERIAAISVVERTPSGRAVRLQCEGPGGPVEVTAKELRDWLGPNWLKSLLFDVRMDGYKIIFEGRGWGHGVGFCQWGAAEMARQGRTAEEIVRFYYPGAVIQSLPLQAPAPATTPATPTTPTGGTP